MRYISTLEFHNATGTAKALNSPTVRKPVSPHLTQLFLQLIWQWIPIMVYPPLVSLQLASAKHTVEITAFMERGCLADEMSAAGKPLVKSSLSQAEDKRLPWSGFPHSFIDLKLTGCLPSGGIEWRVADMVDLGKRGWRRLGWEGQCLDVRFMPLMKDMSSQITRQILGS